MSKRQALPTRSACFVDASCLSMVSSIFVVFFKPTRKGRIIEKMSASTRGLFFFTNQSAPISLFLAPLLARDTPIEHAKDSSPVLNFHLSLSLSPLPPTPSTRPFPPYMLLRCSSRGNGNPPRSDAADHLLVSLLHALTVAVSGSSVRKRRAESIFLSLASPPAPPCSSFSSAPPARGTSLSFSSPPPPRWGLLRFLYEGCLFPAAPTESSLSSSTSSSAAEGTAAAKLAKPTKAAVAESSLGPRCKKKETRSAAFTLLSTLCRGEEDHLRETFGLLGGRDLVSRAAPAATTEAAATSAAATAGGGDGAEVEGTAPGTVSIVPSVDSVSGVDVDVDEASAAASGEPWDYDPTSVLKESGQHVGLQNQVRFLPTHLKISLHTHICVYL